MDENITVTLESKASKSLEQQIKNLSQQIDSLKKEISATDTLIRGKQGKRDATASAMPISDVFNKNSAQKRVLQQQEKQISDIKHAQNLQIRDLEAKQKELEKLQDEYVAINEKYFRELDRLKRRQAEHERKMRPAPQKPAAQALAEYGERSPKIGRRLAQIKKDEINQRVTQRRREAQKFIPADVLEGKSGSYTFYDYLSENPKLADQYTSDVLEKAKEAKKALNAELRALREASKEEQRYLAEIDNLSLKKSSEEKRATAERQKMMTRVAERENRAAQGAARGAVISRTKQASQIGPVASKAGFTPAAMKNVRQKVENLPFISRETASRGTKPGDVVVLPAQLREGYDAAAQKRYHNYEYTGKNAKKYQQEYGDIISVTRLVGAITGKNMQDLQAEEARLDALSKINPGVLSQLGDVRKQIANMRNAANFGTVYHKMVELSEKDVGFNKNLRNKIKKEIIDRGTKEIGAGIPLNDAVYSHYLARDKAGNFLKNNKGQYYIDEKNMSSMYGLGNIVDMVQGYNEWKKNNGLSHVIGSEMSVAGAMNINGLMRAIGGTLDQLWALGNGGVALRDIKTVATPDPATTAQLAMLSKILQATGLFPESQKIIHSSKKTKATSEYPITPLSDAELLNLLTDAFAIVDNPKMDPKELAERRKRTMDMLKSHFHTRYEERSNSKGGTTAFFNDLAFDSHMKFAKSDAERAELASFLCDTTSPEGRRRIEAMLYNTNKYDKSGEKIPTAATYTRQGEEWDYVRKNLLSPMRTAILGTNTGGIDFHTFKTEDGEVVGGNTLGGLFPSQWAKAYRLAGEEARLAGGDEAAIQAAGQKVLTNMLSLLDRGMISNPQTMEDFVTRQGTEGFLRSFENLAQRDPFAKEAVEKLWESETGHNTGIWKYPNLHNYFDEMLISDLGGEAQSQDKETQAIQKRLSSFTDTTGTTIQRIRDFGNNMISPLLKEMGNMVKDPGWMAGDSIFDKMGPQIQNMFTGIRQFSNIWYEALGFMGKEAQMDETGTPEFFNNSLELLDAISSFRQKAIAKIRGAKLPKADEQRLVDGVSRNLGFSTEIEDMIKTQTAYRFTRALGVGNYYEKVLQPYMDAANEQAKANGGRIVSMNEFATSVLTPEQLAQYQASKRLKGAYEEFISKAPKDANAQATLFNFLRDFAANPAFSGPNAGREFAGLQQAIQRLVKITGGLDFLDENMLGIIARQVHGADGTLDLTRQFSTFDKGLWDIAIRQGRPVDRLGRSDTEEDLLPSFVSSEKNIQRELDTKFTRDKDAATQLEEEDLRKLVQTKIDKAVKKLRSINDLIAETDKQIALLTPELQRLEKQKGSDDPETEAAFNRLNDLYTLKMQQEDNSKKRAEAVRTLQEGIQNKDWLKRYASRLVSPASNQLSEERIRFKNTYNRMMEENLPFEAALQRFDTNEQFGWLPKVYQYVQGRHVVSEAQRDYDTMVSENMAAERAGQEKMPWSVEDLATQKGDVDTLRENLNALEGELLSFPVAYRRARLMIAQETYDTQRRISPEEEEKLNTAMGSIATSKIGYDLMRKNLSEDEVKRREELEAYKAQRAQRYKNVPVTKEEVVQKEAQRAENLDKAAEALNVEAALMLNPPVEKKEEEKAAEQVVAAKKEEAKAVEQNTAKKKRRSRETAAPVSSGASGVVVPTSDDASNLSTPDKAVTGTVNLNASGGISINDTTTIAIYGSAVIQRGVGGGSGGGVPPTPPGGGGPTGPSGPGDSGGGNGGSGDINEGAKLSKEDQKTLREINKLLRERYSIQKEINNLSMEMQNLDKRGTEAALEQKNILAQSKGYYVGQKNFVNSEIRKLANNLSPEGGKVYEETERARGRVYATGVKTARMSAASREEGALLREYNAYLQQRLQIEDTIDRNIQRRATTTLNTERSALDTAIKLEKDRLATMTQEGVQLRKNLVARGKEQAVLEAENTYRENRALRQAQNYTNMHGARNVWDMLKNDINRSFMMIFDFGLAHRAMYALIRQITEVINTMKELDAAMVNIQIVTGNTREETTDLMRSYNGLAKQLGATTVEIAKASNEWLRQGYTLTEVNNLIEASTYLSKLGMIDSGQATEYMTSMLKGFKIEAADAMDVVSMLTKLDMEYAASAGDIAEALSRTATSAQMAGMSLEEAAAAVTVIRDVSQKSASSIGESLKTLLSRYGNVKAGSFVDTETGETDESLNDTEKVLNAIGISIRSSTMEFRDFSDVLDDVADKWITLSSVEQNAIATAMAGTRQRENFNILMENYQSYREAVESAGDSQGTAEEKMVSYFESVEAASKRLQAAWEGFAQKINGSPVIIGFTNLISLLVENLPAIINLFVTWMAVWNSFKIPTWTKSIGQFFNPKNSRGSGKYGGFIHGLTPTGQQERRVIREYEYRKKYGKDTSDIEGQLPGYYKEKYMTGDTELVVQAKETNQKLNNIEQNVQRMAARSGVLSTTGASSQAALSVIDSQEYKNALSEYDRTYKEEMHAKGDLGRAVRAKNLYNNKVSAASAAGDQAKLNELKKQEATIDERIATAQAKLQTATQNRITAETNLRNLKEQNVKLASQEATAVSNEAAAQNQDVAATQAELNLNRQNLGVQTAETASVGQEAGAQAAGNTGAAGGGATPTNPGTAAQNGAGKPGLGKRFKNLLKTNKGTMAVGGLMSAASAFMTTEGDTKDKLVSAGIQGGATAIGSIFGPIGGMISSAAGQFLSPLIVNLINKEENERKARVEEAQKRLEKLNEMQSSIEGVRESVENSSEWDAEDFAQIKEYVNELTNSLLEETELRQDFLENLREVSDEWSNINFSEAMNKILYGTQEEKDTVTRILQREEAKAVMEETGNSQETQRHDAETTFTNSMKNADDNEDNGDLVFHKKNINKYSDEYKAWNSEGAIGERFTEAQGLGLGITATSTYSNQHYGRGLTVQAVGNSDEEKLQSLKDSRAYIEQMLADDSLSKYYTDSYGEATQTKKLLEETLDSIEKQITAYENYIDETDVLNAAMHDSEMEFAYWSSEVSSWDAVEIADATLEEAVQLFADQLTLSGVAVRDYTGAVTDEARGMIESYLRQDEKYSSLFEGTNLTLYDMLENSKKLGDFVSRATNNAVSADADAGVITSSFENIKEAFTTRDVEAMERYAKAYYDLNEEASEEEISEAISKLEKLTYKMDPENLETYARALNKTVDEIKEMANLLGFTTLMDLTASPEEIRSSFDDYLTIFEDFSEDSVLTGENLEKLMSKYPTLLNKYTEDGELISSSMDNLYDNLNSRLFGTGGKSSFSYLYANALWGDIKESTQYYKDFISTLSEAELSQLSEAEKKRVENADNLNEIMDIIQNKGLSDSLIEYLNGLNLGYETFIELGERLSDFQQRYNDNAIEALQAQMDALDEINDSRQKELELIKAKDALENAKKEKKLVFRAGVGWTYESDQTAIQDAQQELEGLETDKEKDDLQYQIDQLEKQNDLLEAASESVTYEGLENLYKSYFGEDSNMGGNLATIISLLQGVEDKLDFKGPVNDTGDQAERDQTEAEGEMLAAKSEIESIITEIEAMEKTGNIYNEDYNELIDRLNAAKDDFASAKNTYTQAGGDMSSVVDSEGNTVDLSGFNQNDSRYQKQHQAIKYVMNEIDTKGNIKGEKTFQLAENEYYTQEQVQNGIGKFIEGEGDAKAYQWVVGENGKGKWQKIEQGVDLRKLPKGSIINVSAPDTDASSGNNSFSKYARVVGNGQFEIINALAKGAISTPEDMLSLINEPFAGGTEAIITPQGTITALPAKTGVVPAKLTKSLYSLGEEAPNLIKKLDSVTASYSLGKNSSSSVDNSTNINNLYATFQADENFDFDEFLVDVRGVIGTTRHNG